MKKIIIFKLMFISLLFINCGVTAAADYYVSPAGSNTTGSGSATNPWQTIRYSIGQMSGGDTLIIKDGTYTGADNMISNPGGEWTGVPDGTPGNYTTIKAENYLGAIIDGEHLRYPIWISGNSYIRFENLHAKNTINANFMIFHSDHVKVIRCASEESYGMHFWFRYCKYSLIEECFSWGRCTYSYEFGGDYQNYVTSQYNIVRRCVARRDAHNSWPGGNNYGSFVTYWADNTYFQNNISIDCELIRTGDITQTLYTNSVFYTANGGSNYCAEGNISVNDEGQIGQFESNASPVVMKNNTVLLKQTGNNAGIFTYGPTVTVENNIFGNVSGSGEYTGQTVRANGNPIYSLKNNIIINSGKAALVNVNANNSYNLFYNNAQNYLYSTPGAGDITNVNPSTNGLLYPTRIEAGIYLSTAGEGGGKVGSDITKRIGVPGTLYGEAGWDILTDENLWPWPNENIIKEKMRTYDLHGSNGKKGFCADGKQLNGIDDITLTSYIWEYLGNPIPQSIYGILPATAPSNLAAVALSTGSISLTWTDNSNNEAGFKIERKQGTAETYAQINTVNANTTAYTDGGLQAATTYYYRVRAYNSTANSNYTTETYTVTNALTPDDVGTGKSSNDTVVMKEINEGEAKVLGSKALRGAINPDKGDTARIYFKGKETGRYECRIFTLNGDLLWETVKDYVSEGLFEWIPGDIASGGYIAQVKGPGMNVKRKIVVVR